MSDFAELDRAFSEAKKPTDMAKVRAQTAALFATRAESKAAPNSYENLMASSIVNLSHAIDSMAIGMRATYLLLEKIERQQRIGRP